MMMRRSFFLPALVIGSITLNLVSQSVLAVQTFEGQSPGGAFYTIEAPDAWVGADGLVIYNHGFDIDQVEPDPDLGVLADFVLEQGFAIAASSYSTNGWALFNTLEDNRELYQAVIQHLGEPERVIVFGGSLGGLVTMQAVEQGGIGNVVGGYPVCAPLYGSEVWRQALDLRLIYDAVCDDVSGGSLPGGAEGLPFALDPDQFDGILGNVTAGLAASAANRCLGLGLPEILRSSGQEERMDRVLAASRISEDFLPINLAYATFVMSDLYHDEDKLDGRHPIGNLGVDYEDEAINSLIDRVAPEPLSALDFKRAYTPTGDLGEAKILATSTSGDDLVVVEHLTEYASRAPAAGLVTAVVAEDQPSHCGYTEAELVAGWFELMDWIDRDERPDALSINDRCEELVANGQYPGPCRYDADFDLQPISTRIRERPDEPAPVSPALTGSFFIPGSGGQGWFVEVLDAYRAVVYWFTYSPAGKPVWIGGVGKIIDDAIAVDEAFITSGATFGSPTLAEDVVMSDWGRFDLVFSEGSGGLMRYAGPDDYGNGASSFTQLTQVAGAACEPAGAANYSGLWYPESRPGEGIIIEVQADGRAFVAWFTYDNAGNQTWAYGEGSFASGGVTASLQQFSGPAFGPEYQSELLQAADFGTIRFTLDSADLGRFEFASSVDAPPSLPTETWVRLTRPLAGCDTE